ncbi:MAG: pantetheine-phosphate adenylyltransferase [Candidatus Aureabacteria bacterium]|nr:pantetheine-phosphate adenylyltransferase [Candidatus Auribacterota bacterium]
MNKKAIYAGSFDPITCGHVDVIERASKIFEELVVAVACNISKTPLFSVEERLKHIKGSLNNIRNVKVDSFDGLLVDYARQINAKVLVRGLRALTDFEYEFQMALTNRKLAENIETIFLMPKEQYSYVSSKMIKEIIALGGDASCFVPPVVKEALIGKTRK